MSVLPFLIVFPTQISLTCHAYFIAVLFFLPVPPDFLNILHFYFIYILPSSCQALLQTVDREQREMKELDSARDSLMNLCTPGGRDALMLEISHLHDLCATSEQEVKERLISCETRLGELDSQLARRAGGLKERAAALQWELRSLDQALSYSEPQNNITQLQQHWHSLQFINAVFIHTQPFIYYPSLG